MEDSELAAAVRRLVDNLDKLDEEIAVWLKAIEDAPDNDNADERT